MTWRTGRTWKDLVGMEPMLSSTYQSGESELLAGKYKNVSLKHCFRHRCQERGFQFDWGNGTYSDTLSIKCLVNHIPCFQQWSLAIGQCILRDLFEKKFVIRLMVNGVEAYYQYAHVRNPPPIFHISHIFHFPFQWPTAWILQRLQLRTTWLSRTGTPQPARASGTRRSTTLATPAATMPLCRTSGKTCMNSPAKMTTLSRLQPGQLVYQVGFVRIL